MNLFTDKDLTRNPLYTPFMKDMNDLHAYVQKPCYIDHGDCKSEGCANETPDYWEANVIGYWQGHEEVISRYANDQLAVVYKTLKVSNKGVICVANQTEEWNLFINQALELLDDYHLNRAFYHLSCTNSEKIV